MQSVTVEVCSGEFETRRVTGRDGKSYEFREQRAYLHMPGQPYPLPCQVSLGQRAAWPPGRYGISAQSFRVGRFGSVELNRELALVPLPAAEASPRPAAARAG